MTTVQSDVMVIGGGVAGLVAAITAAREGASVVLLEANTVGGRARTADVGGFCFNLGPHALYERGALHAVCREWGVQVPGGRPALGGAEALYRGVSRRLPTTPFQLLASRLLGVRSKAAGRRAMAALTRTDPVTVAGLSQAEWLAHLGLPLELQDFVGMFVRLSSYTNDPEQLSAQAVVSQYQLALAGVRYLDGGWQTIVDGLTALARNRGVVIHEHRAVTQLGREARTWLAETPTGEVAGSAVILALANPHVAVRVAGRFAEGEESWVDQAGPAVRAAALDLGVSSPATVPVLLGMDEPLYLSTHTPPARLAPEGHGVVHVLRYLGPSEAPESAAAQADLWRHAARAGIERASVTADRYLHAVTVSGGTPLARRNGFTGRPAVEAPGRPGLFLAGDWVGAGSLLADAAAASGHAAGRAAARLTIGAGAAAR